MTDQAHQLVGDLSGAKYKIHAPCFDRAARHARKARLRGLLRESDAAFVLDGLYPERSVGIAAGENHPDGGIAPVGRERFEQRIGRHVPRGRARAYGEMKVLLAHREGGIRRNHVDMIALDDHSLFGLRHRHGRLLCEELRQRLS